MLKILIAFNFGKIVKFETSSLYNLKKTRTLKSEAKDLKIIKPSIDKSLTEMDNLITYSKEYRDDEMEIEGASIKNNTFENEDLCNLSLSRSILENSKFTNCDFEKASFIDVIFLKCDFSNSNFKHAYFSKCEFISCKCLGIDMSETILKQVTMQESNFEYANFNGSLFDYVEIFNSDLTNASISECNLKKFEARNTQFINTSFFRTKLKGIDFTENQMAGIVVSDTFAELKGVVINEYQATDIVKLLGVVIKIR